MIAPTPFAIVHTRDQWLRCRFQSVSFDESRGCLELAWTSESQENKGEAPQGIPAGLAFDPSCRLYHSVPEEGRVEWLPWATPDLMNATIDSEFPQDLFEQSAETAGEGTFVAADPLEGPMQSPRALSEDDRGHLFVAESGRNRVLIYDISDRRLLRVVSLAEPGTPGPSPIDLATCRDRTYVLTANPARLLWLTARGAVHETALPAAIGALTRVAVSPKGRIALLEPVARRIVLMEAETPSRDIEADATDIEFETEDTLAVAFLPGQDIARVSLAGQPLTRPGLKARGYDGRGIVRTPDGRIGFWTARGFRHAAPLRLRYEPSGTVTTFRLDSEGWQTVWGRIYIDACVPEGTSISVYTVTSDEPPDELTLIRTPPANSTGLVVPYPEASPPMPPESFAPEDDDEFRPVFRRETGKELAWAPEDPVDDFVTFEAPIEVPGRAEAGRYLWVTLKLAGTARVTPRVRAVRAEYPSHDYLRRLPRTLSREPRAESFLRRYLAIAEGFLRETDARAYERATLLNPWATPDEAIPWLASFVGLLLDERWARAPRPGGRVEDVRRQLVAEVNDLFRFRGTVHGLRRFLEIYTDARIVILEHFRLRGLGGGMLGREGSVASNAVVGGGFRIGGTFGAPGETFLEGTTADAFQTHAHRFSVIATTTLTAEQRSVIDHILETHRPAHTIVDFCAVGAGFRVGQGAHAGLSSIVGRSGAFRTVRVGAVVGRDAILGYPKSGATVGSPLGPTTSIG